MHPSLSRAAEPSRPSAPSLPVICPACDHGNPAGARYCNACGAPVHLRPCPVCEAINDGAATQCYRCAGDLSVVRAAAVRPRDEPTFPNLASVRECPQCNAINDSTASFCHHCEAVLTDVATEPAAAEVEGATDGLHPPAAIGAAEDPGPSTRTSHEALAAPSDVSGAERPHPAVEGAGAREPLVEQAGARASFGGALEGLTVRAALDDVIAGDAVDAPAHYIGGLSAPLDEAELPEPEPKGWRAGWVLASMITLAVVPVVSAIGWHGWQHPERVAEAVDRLRNATAALLPRTEYVPASVPVEPPAPAATSAPAARSAAAGQADQGAPPPAADGAQGRNDARATEPARAEPSVAAPPVATTPRMAAATQSPKRVASRSVKAVAKLTHRKGSPGRPDGSAVRTRRPA